MQNQKDENITISLFLPAKWFDPFNSDEDDIIGYLIIAAVHEIQGREQLEYIVDTLKGIKGAREEDESHGRSIYPICQDAKCA